MDANSVNLPRTFIPSNTYTSTIASASRHQHNHHHIDHIGTSASNGNRDARDANVSTGSATVGRATPLATTLYMLKICTGAGLLALPHAFQQVGIVAGCIGVIFVCLLNDLSCRILVRCKSLLYLHVQPPKNADAFAFLASTTLGHWGEMIVHLSIVLTLLGAVAIYLITISALFSEVQSTISSSTILFILFLLLAPFTYFRDLSFLTFASILGVCTYAIAFLALFYDGFRTHELNFQSLFTVGSPIELFRTFGVLSFSLGVPVLTFSLQESMANPALFVPALDLTLTIVAFIFIGIGTVGDALYSHSVSNRWGSVQPIVLSNLSLNTFLAVAVKTMVSITLFLTAPLSLAPALNLLENMCFNKRETSNSTADNSITQPLIIRSPNPHRSLYGGTELYNESSEDETDTPTQSKPTIVVHGRMKSTSLSHLRGLSRVQLTRGDNDETDSNPLSNSNSPFFVPSSEPHSKPPSFSLLSSPISPFSSPMLRSSSRIIILFLLVILADVVPCFTLIMSCIGCFTLSILSFILPPVFYIRLTQMGVKSPTVTPHSPIRLNDVSIPQPFMEALQPLQSGKLDWYYRYCYGFLMVGVATMIAGFIVVSEGKCE